MRLLRFLLRISKSRIHKRDDDVSRLVFRLLVNPGLINLTFSIDSLKHSFKKNTLCDFQVCFYLTLVFSFNIVMNLSFSSSVIPVVEQSPTPHSAPLRQYLS